MAPRAYLQERRAAGAAATRRRIVEGAVEVYRRDGVSGATLQSIAAAADVSRGTVANHFGSVDGVLEATLDFAVSELDMPSLRSLDGAVTGEERLRRFVEEMLRFYERTSTWWEVFGSATGNLPGVMQREAWFWGEINAVQAAALGDLATDRIAMGTVSALIQPGTMYALQAAGLTFEEVIEEISSIVVDLGRRRRPEPGGEGGST